jgi:glutamine synthetase
MDTGEQWRFSRSVEAPFFILKGETVMEKNNPAALYGSYVFHDVTMRERLPKNIYNQLKKTIEEGVALDSSIAETVAAAMKDWAIELGATHFTHWFQPLTGITAEKHEAFVVPAGDGTALTEFSGKELIKGEPDASSFPSGGLRATFEARGYTAWDCTSPAFVKDYTLYIPTAFCSYTGEALDEKTPLLRSMEALSRVALKILKLFGDTETKCVKTTMGPEQEYFLVDRALYLQRPDLIFAGRTLFGAKAPKGQELEDQYFGVLNPRVQEFMHELDESLWKLGVNARTKHNEVAPAQHELAPIFSTTNIASDANQITMEMMKKIAIKHGLACLLHEKPFEGINGSGKHNNWSMATDTGHNLLNPGKTPEDNAQFLLFLVAVIRAVDEYAGLLRLSIANAGNDHRLGANEAPPAIVSVHLGEELTAVLDQIETGTPRAGGASTHLQIGVTTLPPLPLDTSDRNRTSPFAFTGNKFEFRMVGSSASIAMPNTVLNTIVAEILSQFYARLEKAADLNAEVAAIVKDVIAANKKVIYNGDNYTPDWVREAARRGLKNIRSTVDAIGEMLVDKNIEVLSKNGVLSPVETRSRYVIMLENYVKTVNVEALTALEMANRYILPAVMRQVRETAGTVAALKAASVDPATSAAILADLSESFTALKESAAALQKTVAGAEGMHGDLLKQAKYYRDQVLPKMEKVREAADALESKVDASFWPFPTYADLLFKV